MNLYQRIIQVSFHFRFSEDILENILSRLQARIELGKMTEKEQKLLVERHKTEIGLQTGIIKKKCLKISVF